MWRACCSRNLTVAGITLLGVTDDPPSLGFFSLYSQCLVCIESVDASEGSCVGSAFHIGDGYLVTARHVVQDRRLTAAIPYGSATLDLDSIEIIYPSDESVDLAILRSNFSLEPHRRTRYWGRDDVHKIYRIELGYHLDDWIDDGLTLAEVVMLGYPPIPLSRSPVLVAVAGHVNAVIDPYIGSNHPLFIVSPTPRGGFSGGPVLVRRGGWLLGVTTSSLLRGPFETELGYSAALTVEPLWKLLAENNIVLDGYDREFLKDYGFDLSDEPARDSD